MAEPFSQSAVRALNAVQVAKAVGGPIARVTEALSTVYMTTYRTMPEVDRKECENAFRAVRDGMPGWFAAVSSGQAIPVQDARLEALVEVAQRIASESGGNTPRAAAAQEILAALEQL